MEKESSILLVDDTPQNLQILDAILTDAGYHTRMAPSGQAALDAVEKQLPDLILLDVRMPGMSGYQVCEQLKSDKRFVDIPVIFISALSEIQDKMDAFTAGGVDYITKPFQLAEVLARVKIHLQLHHLQEELQKKNHELEEALASVKTMRGLLPICSHCKKIRDDSGYWNKLEKYVMSHSNAEFTHSLCPDCLEEFYPPIEDEEDDLSPIG